MRKLLISVIAALAIVGGSGALAPAPARACGYEDPVCDVLMYALEKACVKYGICP